MHHRSSPSVTALLVLGALLAQAPAAVAGEGWQVPAALAGTWSSAQRVKVRLIDERGNYRFVEEVVWIQLVVGADGRVDGSVGAAKLREGRVAPGRGWFGRLLGVGSDFVVTGRLGGGLFEADTIPEMEFSAPLDVKEGVLRGTLFQKQGRGVFAMVALALAR